MVKVRVKPVKGGKWTRQEDITSFFVVSSPFLLLPFFLDSFKPKNNFFFSFIWRFLWVWKFMEQHFGHCSLYSKCDILCRMTQNAPGDFSQTWSLWRTFICSRSFQQLSPVPSSYSSPLLTSCLAEASKAQWGTASLCHLLFSPAIL